MGAGTSFPEWKVVCILYGRKFLNGVTDGSPKRALRWPDEPRPTVPFEHWRLALRTRALAVLEAYLVDWPTGFLADADRSHVYRCRFEVDGPVVSPAWLAEVLDALPHRADRCGVGSHPSKSA